jgi:polyphosphate kinase
LFRDAGLPVTATQRLQTDASTPALLNRELSAIELMARVLDLAADPNEPLLERVKFCAIVSSVLDEFFGPFLEHSRLYCFEAGEDKTYLLGSADLMPRNLDHRIEVVVPVEEAQARNEIEGIFKALLADNSLAWELQADATWKRVSPKKSERRRPAQALFIRRRDRARRLARPG